MSLENQKEIPVPDTSLETSIPANTPEKAVAEDPFAKGRERMASIGNFIASAKEKMTAIPSRVGGALSRSWSRMKSVGGEAAAALLSADVLAGRAYKAGESAVVAGGEAVAGLAVSGYETAAEFTKNKANMIAQFATNKVEIYADGARYAKEKTVESFKQFGENVAADYNSLKEFGSSSVEAAKNKVIEVRDAYRQKINDIKMRRLQEAHGKASREAQRLEQQMAFLRILSGGQPRGSAA